MNATNTRIDAWEAHAEEARRRATTRLAADVSENELVATLQELAADLEEIPPWIRAMEWATDDATALVRVLADSGVTFANRDNAPAQIAAAVYAGWLECFTSPHTRPVDWLAMVAHLVEAVAWAIDNPEGTSHRARETVVEVAAHGNA